MSENKNHIINSKESLAVVIGKAREQQEKYRNSIVVAFEDVLLSCYKYSESWYRIHNASTKQYYSFEIYKEFFYSFIIDNSAKIPQVIRYYLFAYFKGSYFITETDSIAIEELKNHAEKMLDEKRKLEQFDLETVELRKMLKRQDMTLALKELLPLYKLEEVGMFETNGKSNLLMFSIYMFNYGYILGKRNERAKKIL